MFKIPFVLSETGSWSFYFTHFLKQMLVSWTTDRASDRAFELGARSILFLNYDLFPKISCRAWVNQY
jgi:hypothetical protein